ncbi:hypothetical protein IID21_01370 [Patescibacteria group bacterium]|nr:hypothetical protein [Patescibacteria group bacterium]
MQKTKSVKYSELLKDIFKPKTKEDFKKLEKLEKLMVEYILIRTMEEMDEKDFRKLENKEFKSLTGLAQHFKKEIPDFHKKLNRYIKEFLNDYVRGK